jgi:hypothetical protein
MKIILITDGDWSRGDSYQDAFEKLEKYVNDNYYRNPDLYDKREVKPEVMIVTDDDTAELDSYGQLITEGGSWWLKIPLEGKRGPSGNYRFDIMQKLKDEDYKEEVENHLIATYGEEFHAFCEKQGYCESGKCEFKGKVTSDDESCFQMWYEKYKKPERDKERKDGKS